MSLLVVAADEPNVGLLRVNEVEHPRQVAPSALTSFLIDVEYAIRTNATIMAGLFEGKPGQLGAELWHSESVMVASGGEKTWPVNLTAPSAEGNWRLTVFAYYREAGNWLYYQDSDQGPGYLTFNIKVDRFANLEIDLGIPNLSVVVDNSTFQTSVLGGVMISKLPVGGLYSVTVPSVVPLENSTRLIFAGWADGNNQSQRELRLDGDLMLAASYKPEYLLRVDSTVPAYSFKGWYDPGSQVNLQVNNSIPMTWPFGSLGVRYVFEGWSGAVQSHSTAINLTINRPLTVNADFRLDYTPLILPSIIAAGIISGVVVSVLGRRARARVSVGEEQQPSAKISEVCENCGEPIEKDWEHCIHCGKALTSSNKAQDSN